KRGASFVCALVLYRPDGTYESFEGRWSGSISYEPAGTAGFGYDPVFVVAECGLTVAQLSAEMKNSMSHRAKALNKLKISLEKRVKA
ncbi:MAG: non-canonical purine NTP pyrophosphatase, partial [Deltaproteobacteria bacterium]|nr:non-canonical purine NTP pyrophosphatase [Deltaproteobacteria bacterium]